MSKNSIRGKTDLATKCPGLVDEWHPTKNGTLLPRDVTAHCNRKVWWICSDCKHEWEAIVANRSKGHGCPVCAHKKNGEQNRIRHVKLGVNDLKSQYPELIVEWDYSKNDILPEEVSAGSLKRVWWKCTNGHEWRTQINVRTRGSNCPYCCGLKIWPGYNDLATLRPDLLDEWDYAKNAIAPEQVGLGNTKKVWWKCKKGHSYSCSVSCRNTGIGCAYCSGRYAIPGENDLKTVFPSLAAEWNYEKNKNLTPSDLKAKSNRKVWWKCAVGHEWIATVNNRASGRGCPECNSRGTSLVECGVAYYLSKLYEVKQRETIHGCELDVYLPDFKIGIEYDGMFYHSTEASEKRENKKNMVMKENHIILLRIKESKTRDGIIGNTLYYIPDGMREKYARMITNLVKMISVYTNDNRSLNVKIDVDFVAIRESYSLKLSNNTLVLTNPEIAAEWNYEKNGKLLPDMFSSGSSQMIWWKCSKGHEWKTRIASRTRGTNCPFCSGKKTIEGVNDLATLFPQIAKEWDYSNNLILPNSIMPGSQKKVWWICSNNHSYMATPYNRTRNASGCTICSNRVVLEGVNDIKTCFPSIASEWDYEKNMLRPEEVTCGSHIKVWWKCKKNHHFLSSVENRTRQGTGCPVCAGKKVVEGVNDLFSLFPTLVKEWDYEKNGEVRPTSLTRASNKKVWWKCEWGHEWQTAVSHRTLNSEKTNCPYCAGQRTIQGLNDLATVNPLLSREWNYERNASLTPEMVKPKSGKRVWWRCPKCGNEWTSTIVNRTVKRSGCPQCKYKWINDR